MYERRLYENMRKNPMDAKIAPSKPKPSSRSIYTQHHEHFNHHLPLACEQIGGEQILTSFIKTQEEKIVTKPPTYQMFDEKKPEPFLAASTKGSMFEAKKPADEAFKPLARRGSVESNSFTDSDAASNLSFAA